MIETLHTTAEEYYESGLFQKNTPTCLADWEMLCIDCEYIPPEVFQRNPQGLYEGFNTGWSMICRAIADILQRKQAPTVTRIRNDTAQCSGGFIDIRKYRHFLEKGGNIEFALDAVLSITENVLLNGGDGWEYETFKDAIEAHPATDLDGAFDVARVKCLEIREGDRPVRMGPYVHKIWLRPKRDGTPE